MQPWNGLDFRFIIRADTRKLFVQIFVDTISRLIVNVKLSLFFAQLVNFYLVVLMQK